MPVANDDKAALQQAWQSVEDRHDPNETALVGGVNLRFNVSKALKAVYISAKIYFKAKTFAYPADVSAILGLGKDVYDLIIAGLDTVRQKVGQAQYTVAAVLSDADVPMSIADLHTRLDHFLGSYGGDELPWYLGIGKGDIDAARAALAQGGGLEAILSSLQNSDLAERDSNGNWKYKARHFTWRGETD